MAPTRKLLFMSNREHGVANVQLAVSYEILTQYPDVEIHFVSFPGLQKHVEAVSSRATRTLTPTARVSPIIFHALPGSSITETVAARFGTSFQQAITHPPGFAGAIESYKRATEFAASWPGEEHLKIYAAAASVIQEVDPALVVLDQTFIPGIEACKNLKVKRLVLSPNAAKDVLVQQQPRGEIFWKYPAISSGFPYPLPLHLIPANIYLVIRIILTLVLSKSLKNKNDYLKKHEHKAAPPFSSAADDPSVPWLFPSLPEIDFPLSFIPPNVTLCGPIIMEFSRVVDIDVELAGWLARGPTVVINLGSLFRYDERSASSMLGAIEFLFERVEDVQVLWKMPVLQDGGGDWVDVMKKKVEGEEKRVRIEQWISAEMAAVLASETVIAAVHHGGASSYHEAICAGVPQVVLPMWIDLYDFTTRVEYLGIGLWGSRKSAPGWDATELGEAITKVVQDNEVSRAMRTKARELSKLCRKEEGRKVAARKIYEAMED